MDLEFSNKKSWRAPSKSEYLEQGLQKFLDTYRDKKISSIAFPLLGTSHGGIAQEVSLEIMKRYLKDCSIPIEIYQYDPEAPDDLFPELRAKLFSLTDEEIMEITGLSKTHIKKVQMVVEQLKIQSLMSFLATKGIGIASVENVLKLVK